MQMPERTVLLSNGDRVRLAELYVERPLALVFLRHLGCVFCRQQVADLNAIDDNIVFVVLSDRLDAEEFREEIKSPHQFICDPEGHLYREFGLKRGKATQIFNPRTFARGMKGMMQGHATTKVIGDPWQLGGTFLINTEGVVVHEHRSADASDVPKAATVASKLDDARNREQERVEAPGDL